MTRGREKTYPVQVTVAGPSRATSHLYADNNQRKRLDLCTREDLLAAMQILRSRVKPYLDDARSFKRLADQMENGKTVGETFPSFAELGRREDEREGDEGSGVLLDEILNG